MFLTNGAQWQAQRRIIDPVREVMPQAAANAAVDRIEEGVQERNWPVAVFHSGGVSGISRLSTGAAHFEYRGLYPAAPLDATLFNPPFGRAYSQLITRQRADQIAAGTAPDDLATKIMTTLIPKQGAVLNGVKWWIRWRYFSWPVMKPVHLRLLGRSTFWRKIKTCKRALLKRCRRMI